jgi:hypothetical protein
VIQVEVRDEEHIHLISVNFISVRESIGPLLAWMYATVELYVNGMVSPTYRVYGSETYEFRMRKEDASSKRGLSRGNSEKTQW